MSGEHTVPSRAKVLDFVKSAVADEADCSADELTESTTMDGDLRLDSLSIMQIVMDVEEEYDISLADDLEQTGTDLLLAFFKRMTGLAAFPDLLAFRRVAFFGGACRASAQHQGYGCCHCNFRSLCSKHVLAPF